MNELYYFDCIYCGARNYKSFESFPRISNPAICKACHNKDPMPNWAYAPHGLRPQSNTHAFGQQYQFDRLVKHEVEDKPTIVFQDDVDVEELKEKIISLENSHKTELAKFEQRDSQRTKELQSLRQEIEETIKLLVERKERKATKKTRELEEWLTEHTIKLNELADEMEYRWQNK